MLDLEEVYRIRCNETTDINQHLETLRGFASTCRHVTEMGTRTANSTIAFLAAKPERLVCYDFAPFPELIRKVKPPETSLELINTDTSKLESIELTDLLFIDTTHTGKQLRAELRLSPFVRKYIVLHDTETYLWHGDKSSEGLGFPILELLLTGTFDVFKHFRNNNGLTVLMRRSWQLAKL